MAAIKPPSRRPIAFLSQPRRDIIMKLLVLAALIGACAAAPQQYYPQYRAPQYSPDTRAPQYSPDTRAPQYSPDTRAPQYSPATRAPQYSPDTRARAAVDRGASILRSDAQHNEGGYRFAYDTDNGISAEETGVEANGIQASGQYSYTGDDGQVYSVRYTADANGFQPQGAHIPTPPPIPEAIARALQQNAADEARGVFDDGSYNEGKYDQGSIFAARAYNQYQPQPTYQPQPAFQPQPTFQPAFQGRRYNPLTRTYY